MLIYQTKKIPTFSYEEKSQVSLLSMLLLRIRFVISDALYDTLPNLWFEHKAINVGIPILVHARHIETSYEEGSNNQSEL